MADAPLLIISVTCGWKSSQVSLVNGYKMDTRRSVMSIGVRRVALVAVDRQKCYQTYPSDVSVLCVEDFVPKSMELINIIVVLQWERIGSLVTIWELSIEPVFIVEGLDDISNIVDEQSECI